MNWQLIIEGFAKKQLKRFPKNDKNRIVAAIDEISINPYLKSGAALQKLINKSWAGGGTGRPACRQAGTQRSGHLLKYVLYLCHKK